MKIGFTGTQKGMTEHQKEVLHAQLKHLKRYAKDHEDYMWEFHHGDCVGADEEACKIASDLGYKIHCHPPHNDSKRAYTEYDVIYPQAPYLERNRDIVNAVEYMLAAPKELEEQLRSGTWATIRYTKKKKKPLGVLLPN